MIHTDAPFTAQLHTGSAMINQLWSNILWGQRSNFVGVPTDCPQRDERLGWTADAQVFWRTASYDMNLAQFSKKFAADLRGTQIGTDMYGIIAPGTASSNPGFGAGWSDAGVIIPWTTGCNREIRASSRRTGRRWRSICSDRVGEPGLYVGEGLRDSLRRLAVSRGKDDATAGCDRLLGV